MKQTVLREENLEALLTKPSERLIADMGKISGDIMVLGAGGKMGPTLCRLIQNAAQEAGASRKVFAVSRFSDESAAESLQKEGIEVLPCDLLDEQGLASLPDAANIIYMAGRKFGTSGAPEETWAVNAVAPALAARRFAGANMVVFSSGNIYPPSDLAAGEGASTEETPVSPMGEYAMSCLARERIFAHGALAYGTKTLLFRLNYAVDLRYGVLYDIGANVLAGEPVSLTVPFFNCIWQGDANEAAVRALLHTAAPAAILNVTGPEMVSVAYAAKRFGELFGKAPVFTGEAGAKSLVSNSGKAAALFGYPQISLETLIDMQAAWLLQGGRGLGKPTHFEIGNGEY